jgi:glutathione peroxidase
MGILLGLAFVASLAAAGPQAETAPAGTSTAAVGAASREANTVSTNGVHQFTVKTIEGKDRSLGDYAGKVLLIVNVASECGFTPQYKDLEALYLKYKDRGFAILGFPSNDFHHQEPGTDEAIKSFCDRNYQVTFDLFPKVHAKEDPQAPLYRYLTTQPGFEGPITWNFNKFLVGKDGKVLARFDSKVKPLSEELVAALEKALK